MYRSSAYKNNAKIQIMLLFLYLLWRCAIKEIVIDIYFSCLVVISLLDLILIINFVYYKISKFKYRLLVFRPPFKMNENTTNEVNQSFHPNKQFFIELGN